MKKRLSVLLLSMALIFSLVSCTPTAHVSPSPTATSSPAPQAGEFKPGTYTGTADGRNGPVTVEVTFSADAIDSVSVGSHEETAGIADPALEKLPASIVEQQSLGVDTVAGATLTSDAILAAVGECITQAGGDAAVWKAKSVTSVQGEDENLTADVVIAGAGVAGLSAGIEAARAGAKVILVEKLAVAGGSTSMSAGKVLAADSYVQKRLGINDSPEFFAEYLMKISHEKADPDFIKLVTDSSSATIDWMVEQGVRFKDEVETPMADMLPKRGLMAADDSGASLIAALQQTFESLGGTLLLETPATELITDSSGTVIGLTAVKSEGGLLTVHAGAVVLATGGFTANQDLLKKYAPSYDVGRGYAGAGNTGDGLLMAEKVGADIFSQDCLIAQLTDIGPTGRADAAGLFVTEKGERFMNENLARPRKARASIEAIGQTPSYYIHDESEVTPEKMAAALEAGTAFEADSVEELAKLIGADPTVLQATLERYNELCDKGEDKDFGKDAAALKAISQDGKLYAIRLKISTSGSTGGPRIDLEARVLDKAGQPISGLYAAGEVASGSFFAYEYPGSGSAIQCYATFGRIAGQNSAAEALGK